MGAMAKARTTAKARQHDPNDRRAAVEALRDHVVQAHGRAPATDGKQTAIRDAWTRILRDRAKRMRRRLDDMLKARRWILDGEAGVALSPAHWTHVIRQDAAYLYADFGGALRQFHTIRVTWRAKGRFGMLRGRNAPVGSKKAIADQKKKAAAELAKRTAAERKAYRATLDKVLTSWAASREALTAQMQAFQALMDGLLAREEERLTALAATAPDGVRAKAKGALAEMKALRLDAKSFATDDGRNASKYGSLLREWVGARRRAARAVA